MFCKLCSSVALFGGLSVCGMDTSCIPEKIDHASAPVIDGKLDDKVWLKAKEFGPFLSNQVHKMPLTQQSWAKLAVDGKYLYWAVYCEEKEPGKLVQDQKNDGSSEMWTDDCVEIFIAPDYMNLKHYAIFTVNTLGKVSQMLGKDGGWQSGVEVASYVGVNYWSTEGRLPLASLQLSEKDVFGMCICRSRFACGSKEYGRWPVGGDYHIPSGHVLLGSYKPFLEGMISSLKMQMAELNANKHGDSDESSLSAKFAKTVESIENSIRDGTATPEIVNKYIADAAEISESAKLLIRNRKYASGISSVEKENAFIVRSATSLEKIFQYTFKPEWKRKGKDATVEISMAGNELESFQAVIIPLEDINKLTWDISGSFPANRVRVQPVGYVDVHVNSNHEILQNYPADMVVTGKWPDPLFSTWDSIEKMPARQIQPVWITIDTADDVAPGDYTLTIEFKDSKGASAKIDVAVKVWNFSLPSRTTLKTDFWWADSNFTSYYPEIAGNPEKYKALIRDFQSFMLDNRMTPVDLGPFKRIKVTSPSPGKWQFDFTAAEEMLNHIFNRPERPYRQGNVYKALTHETYLIDGKPYHSHNDNYKSDENREFLLSYLQAAKNFHKDKSWSKNIFLSPVDEPSKPLWDKVRWIAPILKNNAPDWPMVSSLNEPATLKELTDDIDIMAPGILANLDDGVLPYLRDRQNSGHVYWGYICYKTACVDFESIDHRMIPWYCWQYDFKGLLYWGFSGWNYFETPLKSKDMFVKNPEDRWPNKEKPWRQRSLWSVTPGDGYLLYPSPNGKPWSSIRLENIRDGIEDYEYCVMLKGAVERMKNQKAPSNEIAEGESLLNETKKLFQSTNKYTRDWRKLLELRQKTGSFLDTHNTYLK